MLDTNDEMLTPIKATIGTKVRNVICEEKQRTIISVNLRKRKSTYTLSKLELSDFVC